MTAKIAPRFAPDALRKYRDENVKSCRRPLVDSAPFTNTYRRAVSGKRNPATDEKSIGNYNLSIKNKLLIC